MALSPADILQRLKQLKIWQQSQEELLRNAKKIVDNTSVNNITTASDYHSIEGLSEFDTSNDESSLRQTTNIDLQIISPSKSFHELLEEKLAEDEAPTCVVATVKRPFLRKGAGLERYRMTNQAPRVNVRKKVRSKSESSVTPLRVPKLGIQPRASWDKVEDVQEHVRRINAHVETTPEVSEQSLYEKQLEKELLMFEALEQRANNSSFCSTNSSVINILSSTPSKMKPRMLEEKRVHWETPSEVDEEEIIETNLKKDDIAEILLRLKNMSEHSNSESERTEDSSETTSVTSEDLEETLKTETRDVAISTEVTSNEMCVICEDKYEEKVTEYEKKVQAINQEKKRLDLMKKQYQQKERDFLKKKREFDEERQDNIFELETEKKKLQKEKQSFQIFMRESQARPSKKERQEITNLKQELADLNETVKLKEAKNGMTQARLRNQIKHLEKENVNLKNEVERLTKENAKLSAADKMKKKTSDAKILQEINKNVTKLTQQSVKQNKKVINEVEKIKAPVMLDTEDSLLIMDSNIPPNELEVQYEKTFRRQTSKSSDKHEAILDDGRKEITYGNGNIKTVSPNGNLITVQYFNGDKQETNLMDGTVKYYFSSRNICQTTFADGLEVVEFPEGMIEKRYTDGKCEITLPDGVVQTTFPNGNQETKYTDGSLVKIASNGEKILLLPNGQKEIETKEYKRREYPDGTIKTVYPDGTQETKYSNGRIRIKDANGTLVLDTQC